MPRREVPLRNQVYAYWRAAFDLRLTAQRGGDVDADLNELLDLADFTDHPPLRRAVIENAAAFAGFKRAEAV